MNALTSYLRHLIVTGILLLVEKFKLPIEGADQAADIIALALIGTLSWAFVKYLAPFLKIPKGSGVALFALAASLALLTPSCVNSYIVDGAGRDWESNPVQTLPANRVTPVADVPLPENLGGGIIPVPITIIPTK